MKILRELSKYLDDELPTSVCREIRKHLGQCPKCELFLKSLRRTIHLCRQLESHRLSVTLKARIRQAVLQAARHAH